eukprot:CAMPEP_0172582286 /NCGR_PEP_ID=MMETSP1068-20121228/1727_1 /TAXON_ID=35684 /ORGANISM="Pseudopedinella elastica, Strain CCMP716" /LENGTH=364 /DNA_ID=CAMNT_0013375591 /DNA_START=36 /DNA_END=1130 /DNA_ORIENTATION=-
MIKPFVSALLLGVSAAHSAPQSLGSAVSPGSSPNPASLRPVSISPSSPPKGRGPQQEEAGRRGEGPRSTTRRRGPTPKGPACRTPAAALLKSPALDGRAPPPLGRGSLRVAVGCRGGGKRGAARGGWDDSWDEGVDGADDGWGGREPDFYEEDGGAAATPASSSGAGDDDWGAGDVWDGDDGWPDEAGAVQGGWAEDDGMFAQITPAQYGAPSSSFQDLDSAQPTAEEALRNPAVQKLLLLASWPTVGLTFAMLVFRMGHHYESAPHIGNAARSALVRSVAGLLIASDAVCAVACFARQRALKSALKTMLVVNASWEGFALACGLFKIVLGKTGFLSKEEVVATMVWNFFFASSALGIRKLNWT